MFERKSPEINMKIRNPESSGVRDDEIHIVSGTVFSTGTITDLLLQNTQSGTQWDGLRHFPILEHGVFYNKFSRSLLCHLKPV
jgi:hypothetical protein